MAFLLELYQWERVHKMLEVCFKTSINFKADALKKTITLNVVNNKTKPPFVVSFTSQNSVLYIEGFYLRKIVFYLLDACKISWISCDDIMNTINDNVINGIEVPTVHTQTLH